MGEVLIREIDDGVLVRLRTLAQAAGTSSEALARDILTRAVTAPPSERAARAQQIRQMSPIRPSEDSADLIRMDRDAR